MHSAKDKHFRSFPIGTEVLSFADSKTESSSSQHMNIFKEEGSLAPEFDIETSSGAGYSSSEMIMSLICLLKMPAAAYKHLLSSHIWDIHCSNYEQLPNACLLLCVLQHQ
jgi:hypothetical protein